MKGRGLYRTMYFVPVVTTASVVGIIMIFILGVQGPVNHLLISLHILKNPINFLGNAKYALPTLVIISLWKDCGTYMIYWLAGLQGVSQDVYEAATIDGANRSQTFLHIILPQVIKRILPSVTNEVITLVKDTSLAFVIAVSEMFTIAKALASSQANMIPYVLAGIFYYIFNFIVAFLMEKVEKKMNYYK